MSEKQNNDTFVNLKISRERYVRCDKIDQL